MLSAVYHALEETRICHSLDLRRSPLHSYCPRRRPPTVSGRRPDLPSLNLRRSPYTQLSSEETSYCGDHALEKSRTCLR